MARKVRFMYDIKKYDGKIVPDSLGNFEYEEIARIVLTKCKEKGEITGIDRKEVEDSISFHPVHIDDLIKKEYLKEDKNNKLYPTEKLLENQKVPKI